MKLKKIKFLTNTTNDIVLKIYAVVLAVLIWFIISVTLYPTVTRTINNVPVVPIVTKGTAAEDFGLRPVNIDKKEISVRIFGKRYNIGDLSAEDLQAQLIVDSNVNKPGEYELEVKIVSKKKTNFDIKNISPSRIKVKFDSIIEKEFPIEVEAPNITVASGYLIEPITVNPNTIKVKGPKEEIEKITKVVARTEEKKSLSESLIISEASIVVYNGETIMSKENLNFNTNKIELRIPILMQKSLPFKLGIQNAPPDFDLSSLKYSLSKSKIDIAAPVNSIRDLGEVHLGYLNLHSVDLNSSFVYNVELPEKYKNLSGYSSINVNFDWSNYSSKTISLDKSKIFIVNAPSKFNIKIKTNNIWNIKLIGPKSVIDKITASNVIAEIDLLEANLNQSTYSMPVQIYSPQYHNIWAYGNYNATISVSDK